MRRRNPGDQQLTELQRNALRDPQAMQQLLIFALRRGMIDENAIGALVAMGLKPAESAGPHTRLYHNVPHYSQAFSYYREPATLFNHPFESSLMLCRAAANVVNARVNVDQPGYEIETRNTKTISALHRRAAKYLDEIERATPPGASETRHPTIKIDQARALGNTGYAVREMEADYPANGRARGVDGRSFEIFGDELSNFREVAEAVATFAAMVYTLDQGFDGSTTVRSRDTELFGTVQRDCDVLLACAVHLSSGDDAASWSTQDYRSFREAMWEDMPVWFLRRFGVLPQRP